LSIDFVLLGEKKSVYFPSLCCFCAISTHGEGNCCYNTHPTLATQTNDYRFAETMTRITLKNVSKRYDNGFEAVKDVSLDIQSGEFVVLLGPSGCGKSTTLRMIAGLETISSGDLEFDGERINGKEPKDRDVGMVFQNYALYPHLNVYDNLAFPLKLRREAKSSLDMRVREIAAVTGLADLLQRKPRELSGGQRQRVALGRAIIRKPRVFLFDEPLSNLDAQLRLQMRSEITRLQRLVGATAVYVTHDQTEAMTMGDKIVLMNNGTIQQIGTPSEIYHKPDNVFVAQFLGSPSINLIAGRLAVEHDAVEFWEQPSGGGEPPAAALRCVLPSSLFRTFPPQHGSRVLLGVRPEHFQLTSPSNEPHPAWLDVTVEHVEYLGHELLVYASNSNECSTKTLRLLPAGNQQFRLPQNTIRRNQSLRLFVSTSSLVIFGENGTRL